MTSLLQKVCSPTRLGAIVPFRSVKMLKSSEGFFFFTGGINSKLNQTIQIFPSR